MENYGFWEKLRARLKKGGEERQRAARVKDVLTKIFLGGEYYV
jgi:hypothetical protein